MAERYLLLLVFCSISTSFIVHSLEMNVTRTTPNEIEGETTSFTCTVDELRHGYLKWYLDKKPLDPSSCSGSYVPNPICLNVTLYINDSGKILECTTVGERTNTVQKLQLNVLRTSLITEASTTQPESDERSSTTRPGERTSTTRPDEGTSTTRPDERTSTWQPDEITSTTRPNERSSTTQPGERTSTIQPNERTSTRQPDEGTSTDILVSIKDYVIVSISIVLCLCVAIVIVRRFLCKPIRRQPPSRNEDTKCPSEECGPIALEESDFQLPEVDYSFHRENIELLEVLGCGNFGQVYKAIAEDILEAGTKTLVAVKILKNFEKEIAVHKTLTKHPNVVSMLGYCTERDPFHLILEFLSGGNLQDYLRKKKLSWKESKVEDLDVEPVSPFQLLTFASQIANGMDYLSFKGCIHRDLASRNILLSGDLVCKLSDFGLARDVSATEQYEMASKGLVPVRWFAMECLVDNTYTTMSDVWSFGVLLWEIVTLGAHPYRGMSYTDIIDCLVEGHRLPQPGHCSKQLFSIMKECWKEVPRTRPTFLSLKRTLDVMIADAPMFVNMSNFQPDKYI